jgi:hypothetical protein
MFGEPLDYLSRQIGAALETLTFEHHFAWPVYVAIIAANGSMLGVHYRVPGEEAQIVAQHVEAPGFEVPVSLVFVSSGDGRTANVLISRSPGDSEVPHV